MAESWRDAPIVEQAPTKRSAALSKPSATPAAKRKGIEPFTLNDVAGGLQSALDFASLGSWDEAQGGLAALGAAFTGKNPGEAFQAAQQAGTARRKDFAQRRPWANSAAQTVGGAIPALLTAGATAPLTADMQLGRIAANATPLKDASRIGAGVGGIAGFMGAEGSPQDRLPSAAAGAGVGAVLAPATVKASELAGDAALAATRWMFPTQQEAAGFTMPAQTNMSIGAPMPGMTPPGQPPTSSAQKAVNKQMVRAMTADEVTPQIMQERAAAAQARGEGDITYAGEMAGPNMQEMTRSVMSVPGVTKTRGERLLEQRAEGAPGRLKEAANKQLNPSGTGLYAELDDITRMQKGQADKLFSAADRTPVTPADMKELGPLLGTDAGQRAVAQAMIIASNNRRPVNFEQPDFLTLRTVREGLDSAIDQAARINPTTGKKEWDRAGASMIEVRSQLDRVMKKMSRERSNDALARADAAWAGPERQKAALEAGRKVFTTDEELSAARIAKMSADERRAYKIGVARAIIDKVANTTDGATANYAGKIAGKQILRDRLRPSFLTQKAYDDFMADVDREIARMQFARNVLPSAGSKTQPAMTGLLDLFADMAEQSPNAQFRKAIVNMARIRGEGPTNPAVNSAFADTLFAPADDMSNILSGTFAEYQRQLSRQAAARAAGAQRATAAGQVSAQGTR